MKIINQCGTLFFVCLCGLFLARLCPVPTPGSVMSMALLFVLLLAGALREENLKEITDFLTGNMAFFFIPSGVGILEFLDARGGDVLKMMAVCAVSALLTFAASAFAVTAAVRLRRGARRREGR